MSLFDQQMFLAKLYTNENFRNDFIAEPEAVGFDHNLNKEEIADILAIYADEIKDFSESLLVKRLREVENYLPGTRKELGEDFGVLFREFIKEFNPQTVKKHLEDAVEFAEFLNQREFDHWWIRDVAKLEKAKLLFGGFEQKFVFRSFDFDIRNLEAFGQNRKSGPARRRTFAVWINLGKFHRHFIF